MMPTITIRLVGYILTGIALIWALWFAYDLLTASDKVKGRLGENQTDAATESGSDAVETLGGQAESEGQIDDDVKDVNDEIDSADNTSDVVDAALDGLCDNFGICTEE